MTDARKKILLVEDDESITLGLSMNLEAEGYDVAIAADGESALDALAKDAFALVVLDVMLPKVNGFEVVRRLRGVGNRVPVVMLSARGAEIDKVMGLELGAEDYITKPFSLAEFLARVKAVLRRDAIARPEPDRKLALGPLQINMDTREVSREGTLVELTATEFDLLLCLVEATGRVLSRDEILGKVWGPGHHGTLRTIDNFVLQLRSKLEEDPTAPRHILTVRGVGYRFQP
ncbi:MAG TPA: response regulator transcription factor [Polyangiaceae bacterium]|nr:response regulator transcription factor [Polyangiaceae bacterium]HMR73788.1 response regulator transcription factor [Polyangiaceae bacterium]